MKRILGLAAFSLALGGCGGGLPAVEIEAVLETASVAGTGDAADDPAVWVSDTPADSLIFGTDKDNGVYVYTLTGAEHAYLPEGRLNNVDVRYDFALGDRVVDIAGASDRSNIGIAFFFIDPDTRDVSYAGAVPLDNIVEPYGFCFYRSRQDGELYAFVSDKEPGTFIQVRVGWNGESVTAEEVNECEGRFSHSNAQGQFSQHRSIESVIKPFNSCENCNFLKTMKFESHFSHSIQKDIFLKQNQYI